MVGAPHYRSVSRSTCKYCCLSSAFGCFLSPLLMTNKKKKDREKEKERERANKKAIAISFSSTAAGFSFCQAH